MTTCDECRETREALCDDALLCSACRLDAARAAGAAEERARIVAMLRREADGWERAYPNGDEYADGHVAGFREMADRIERGDT